MVPGHQLVDQRLSARVASLMQTRVGVQVQIDAAMCAAAAAAAAAYSFLGSLCVLAVTRATVAAPRCWMGGEDDAPPTPPPSPSVCSLPFLWIFSFCRVQAEVCARRAHLRRTLVCLLKHRVVGVAFQNLVGAENIGFIIPTTIIRHFLEEAASVRSALPGTAPARQHRPASVPHQMTRRRSSYYRASVL
jgi:hypothetical protein